MADRGARKSRRGMRDEAGVGPNPRDARRLVPMKDLHHYKVVDGEPDIRGWSVFTANGRELGDIQDLLVDTDLGEVVMIDIDLKRDDRHTLAPIKAAWIDRETHRVVLNTSMFDVDGEITSATVPDTPADATARRAINAPDRDVDDVRTADLQPERRRFVRYGPTHDKMVVEEVVRRRVVDPADMSPSETERLRQESGDITTDARDTLVNPPPTEERR
jgi:sporulation protein YlmC with PRC-barrel domain